MKEFCCAKVRFNPLLNEASVAGLFSIGFQQEGVRQQGCGNVQVFICCYRSGSDSPFFNVFFSFIHLLLLPFVFNFFKPGNTIPSSILLSRKTTVLLCLFVVLLFFLISKQVGAH